MIGVIVPAHDEAEHIASCIRSVLNAAACPELHAEPVLVMIVLDACTDATGEIARGLGVETMVCAARNVGIARAMGAKAALERGARWLAFTDADSHVAPDWLSKQLGLGCEAVCGTVSVRDWSGYSDDVRRTYDRHYTDAEGHRHIHGANLGVSSTAYRRVGGFSALRTSEDVALVRALEADGASIAWTSQARVATSARRHFKAPGGFGSLLRDIERRHLGTPESKRDAHAP